MSVGKPWSFGKEHGFTGSAKSEGTTSVRAHERSVNCYAKGGKVAEGKSTTPPPRPQKHYDRMENYRKEQDAEPASPAAETNGMKSGGKWIRGAIKKPGALHKELGVPKGEKIPAKKLASAAKKPGKVGQRARLAETMKKFAKGGKVDLTERHTLGIPGGDGTKNVVGFKKGGKAKGKSGGKSSQAMQQKAAGALAQIAAATQGGGPAAAPGGMAAPPGGIPGMGGPPPPQIPPPGAGGPPGMRRGGKTSAHKKK